MIKQRVKLIKLKTDNGRFDFTNKGVPIGTEFYVDILSISVMNYRNKETNEIFRSLSVKTADEGIFVPVEVLEFSNEFEVVDKR